MQRRRRRLQTAGPIALASALAALVGCIAETPPNAMPAPDTSRIVVFFPVNGAVRGRGSAGALPDGATHVYIAPHPSPGSRVVPANADGSFSFSIGAGSSDVLEIAALSSEDTDVRGAPTFVRVPATRVFPDEFYCCKVGSAANGKCVAVSEEAPICDGDISPLFTCRVDAECAQHSGRTIDFPLDGLIVSTPDAEGRINVRAQQGAFPAFSLIQMENRGKRFLGSDDPRLRIAEVTDVNGMFEMSFPARGDDELVFQIFSLEGLRSREHAALVPDAALAGLDIVGVYPFDQLTPERTGRVAVRLSPFGVDGFGICPDGEADPVLCFTGGLDYSMIELNEITLDTIPISVTPSSPTEDVPNTRATDGDVLGGPQVLGLILDTGAAATNNDAEGVRFDSAIDFVNALRARDRLTLATAGGTDDGFAIVAGPTNDKMALRASIEGLKTRTPVADAPSDIFGAIARVSTNLRETQRTLPNFRRGQILVVTTVDPSGGRAEADAALAAVLADEASLFSGYPTSAVGLRLEGRENTGALRDLAVFSGGEFIDLQSVDNMLQAVARVTGAFSGAFVLLYDMPIPSSVGKAAQISINATVRLPGGPDGQMQTQDATFNGTLEVRGAVR